MEAGKTCPLPDNPALAAWAGALNQGGYWAEIVDSGWRCSYMTDDARLLYDGQTEFAPYPVGVHTYGPEAVSMRMGWRGGQWPLEINRRAFAAVARYMLADTPGGREELCELVDPRLRDILDELTPEAAPPAWTVRFQGLYTAWEGVDVWTTCVRVRDSGGELVGTAFISKPAVGMATLTRISAIGDLRHFKLMEQVARPGRRPAGLLFADLEGSTPVSRRLSTHAYFALGRRVVRAVDQCVINAGGLVGRHAGDGVVGFFLAETAGSESAAAKSCIHAARSVREAMVDVAARSDLAAEQLTMRFGLHWGATLYVGQIATGGRTEVNGLGDEVNEAARIEACATGGRVLASKALIERLDAEHAAELGIDLGHITYIPLAELPTTTEKARRDAPALAVCEL